MMRGANAVHENRIMRSKSMFGRLCMHMLLASAMLIVVEDATSAQFIDLRRIERVHDGDVAAGREKSATCVACHSDNGVSPAPIFPDLRGQTVEYLYWQLVDFKQGQTPMSVMEPIVAPLSDQDLRDVAAFYAQVGNQPVATAPAPVAPADQNVLADGERLYLNGDAQRGVPPCQGCHGADGEGHPQAAQSGAPPFYRTYPALRGQKAAYLVTKLTEFHEGKLSNSTNDFIMTGVARNLDEEAVQAIATWLATRPSD